MIEDLFFNTAPAILAIFQLGFEPKEECFYELTNEQYEQLRAEGENVAEAWYMILPKEYKYLTPEAIIATEQQKISLIKAAKVIENYCKNSGKTFYKYEDKLKYVSNLLPPIFTKESKFERRHLRLVE